MAIDVRRCGQKYPEILQSDEYEKNDSYGRLRQTVSIFNKSNFLNL